MKRLTNFARLAIEGMETKGAPDYPEIFVDKDCRRSELQFVLQILVRSVLHEDPDGDCERAPPCGRQCKRMHRVADVADSTHRIRERRMQLVFRIWEKERARKGGHSSFLSI